MTLFCDGLVVGFLIGFLSTIVLLYWITIQEESGAQEEIDRLNASKRSLAASGLKETD
jgi:hypothetical protein